VAIPTVDHTQASCNAMLRRDTSPAYRALLSVIGVALLCGCMYLSLGIGAVPDRDLWALLGAFVYGSVFSLAVAPPAHPVRPVVPISPVKPLAGAGMMRLQASVLLSVSAVLSISVPWAWIVTGRLTRVQLEMLAPHLFMMMAQVIFELACYRPTLSLLVRLSVPVLFTAYRLRLLLEWLARADDVLRLPNIPQNAFAVRYLALANLAFWTFVLFYFLLLKVVPRYFLDTDGNARAASDSIRAKLE
jgi:hypothetical protein